MKKNSRRSGQMAAKVGAGAVAAAALAVAGGYILWERMGKVRQNKMKAWAVRARKDAVRELSRAKKMSERDYKHVVDRVVKRYGSVSNVSKAELQKAAGDMKAEWKRIQGHAKKLASQMQKKHPARKPARKAAKRRPAQKRK